MKIKELNTCINCFVSNMGDVFTPDNLLTINNNRSEITFRKNKNIIKQGTFISQLAHLKKGIVKIVLEGQNGRNTILEIVEEGSFIALPFLYNPNTYPFSVVSLTECEICFIRKEPFCDIMKKSSAGIDYMLNWYSNDYMYLYERITKISTLNSHGKLASALLYLTNGKFNEDILQIISRQELADLAAISIESSNKILSQLKQDRIIDVGKGHVKILNRSVLEKLSAVG